MTTLTTRAGFEAFRTRMCARFTQLPNDLGKRPLYVEQADLGPNTFFTHRLDDDGHHIVYDPRQTNGLQVRQFLGIYAEFTEHPVTDGVRTAYYDADCDGVREIWSIVLREIDRSQDPGGIIDSFVDLISRRGEKSEARG